MKKTRKHKKKTFVIGLNKTGTTTIEHALNEFGFVLGDQVIAQRLTDQLLKSKTILRLYCLTGEAFQDVPFSLPDFYKTLDSLYPDSKFILSIRDNPDQWFKSLVSFHSKLWGNGHTPSYHQLKELNWIRRGYALRILQKSYGEKLYDSTTYKEVYERHIEEVTNHFKNAPEKLLIINVSERDSYKQLCDFLGEVPLRETFKWKNKTSNTTAWQKHR
ncbi:hypothetical protein BFP72_14925 [Reichenbachiella sp. 5M10]|nr:hypothetical protein BFP72_14925 [Reichenbachiella sp. 5M10]